jgi:hypothetical protein
LNESNTYANFDLSTGTIGTTGSNVSSVTMTSVGSGWYRCSFVITSTTNAANAALAFAPVASNSVGRLPTWTPAGTETIILWGAQVEQRSAVTAYTATTTQAITNYIPVLQTAASGVARFDNNPTTGESLGLLIEESRTNLFTYSSAFDDASWTKAAVSVTGNTVISPDGTLTGDKLISDSASGFHSIYQLLASKTASTAYTFSFYAKAGEIGFCLPNLSSGLTGSQVSCLVNLSTGAVTGVSAGLTATTTSVGNGWWRIVLTATGAANTTGFASTINTTDASGTSSHTGNGFSGIYIWGAQLEAGSFATSYIPTVASQVTRAADAASMTGTNFSSWYAADQGTLYSDFVITRTGTNDIYIAAISNGTTTNDSILLYAQPQNSRFRGDVYIGSSAQCAFTYTASGTPTSGTAYKATLAYKVNDFAMSINSATVSTDTAGNVPVVDRFFIGIAPTSSNAINGTIKKIAYYPLKATSAQLQALTS